MVIFNISSIIPRRRRRSAQAQSVGVSVYVLASSLVACSLPGLPSAGPTTLDVTSEEVKNGQYQFDLIDVDQHVIDTVAAQPIGSFHSRFSGSGSPPEQTISVGDLIGVTIYQSVDVNLGVGTGGTTGTSGQPSNALPATVVPDQLVMRGGTIVVPYVGRVRLTGLSTTKAEAKLQNLLKNLLIQPQVIVSINKSDANTVTVSGEGVAGSRIQLSPHGTRLLDVIASAGGVKSPTYQLLLRLTRGGVTATIPYDVLAADPAENIYAYPGDIITLTLAPPTFGALGATGKPLLYQWGSDQLTLAQAIAMTAGLDDARADPAGVFLMRHEPLSLVQQLGVPSGAPTDAKGFVPVVYRFNLSHGNTYLLAQRFDMKDKDIIYVANAASNSVQKFINLVASAALPAFSGYSTFVGTGATTAIVASPVTVSP